jgi:TRAP-type C4-dicarboxylate transport system substrate-binding protein
VIATSWRRTWTAVAIGLTALAAEPALAQGKPIELRLSSLFGVDHPHHKNVLVPWAKLVEQRSGGRLKIVIYPDSALGKPAEQWDLVRSGAVDISWGTTNVVPGGRFPLTAGAGLPFLYKTAKGGSRALWELVQKDLKPEYEGVKLLWVFVHGPGQLFTTSKPVRRLEDVAGLKIRVTIGVPSAIVTALGGVPVDMPAMDARAALRHGELDGTIFGWDGIVGFRLDNTVHYHTVANLYASPFFFAMNQRRYDELPADLRQVIDELSGAWGAEFNGAGWDKGDEEGIAIVKKAGGDIYVLPAAERERWIQRTMSVEQAWLASTESRGLPGRRVLEDLRALVRKFDP